MMRNRWATRWAGLAVFAAVSGLHWAALAEELNIYSSRHYQTDEALYANFTKKTGIEINRIEGKGDALIERIKSEGANSPADVLITVDAGRLWRADQAGLFQPVGSQVLSERVPSNLRHPEGHWFGFSSRARLILYNKAAVKEGAIARYEDLAESEWRGRVCIRSSSNIYNQSLLGSLIAAHGETGAEDWAKGVVANFARDPKGGDTDQIRSVAAGECDVAVANSYYVVRLKTAKKESDRERGRGGRRGVPQPGRPRHAHQHLRRRRAQARAPSRGRGQVPRVPGRR